MFRPYWKIGVIGIVDIVTPNLLEFLFRTLMLVLAGYGLVLLIRMKTITLNLFRR